MAGITQLPGPGPGAPPVQPPSQSPPPSNQVVTVPVVQTASPYWVDPTTAAPVPIPPPHHQIHYYTIAAPPPPPPPAASPSSQPQSQPPPPPNPPPQHVPSPQQRPPESAPVPRPRKPYTTTKVREMWSPAEHERMLEGLRLYKRDWAKVTRYVGTRSAAQVRSHAQKYFDRVAREKTDDYVPRARPKRKSATPYPRKPREDTSAQHKSSQQQSHQQPHQMPPPPQSAPAPVPISIPVQALHHSSQPPIPPGHSMHAAQVPMQIAAAQSPLMSHVHSGSPYLAHAQQAAMQVPQSVTSAVYSPYITVCAAPPPGQEQRPGVQSSPIPHPSPLSYMSGHSYPAHSPAHPHQQVSIAQPPLYSVFSPLTPSAYPAAVPRAHAVNHEQVSVVPASAHAQAHSHTAHHIPTHTHPNGPVDNCAKCIALRRYGTVLREIGEIRNSRVTKPAGRGTEDHQHSNPFHAYGYPKAQQQCPPRSTSKPCSVGHQRDVSESSGRQRRDGGSTPSSDDLGQKTTAHAAGQRARRAKVMKARKAKTRTAASSGSGKPEDLYASERSSESCNSIPRTLSKEVYLPKGLGSSSKTMKRGGKRSNTAREASDINSEKGVQRYLGKDGRPPKRIRRERSLDMEKKSSEEELSLRIPEKLASNNQASVNSSPATRILCDKSEESGQKGSGSPVETYSPTERKEIFDAVKSLQILAKTSSSPSSSESKPEPSGLGPE